MPIVGANRVLGVEVNVGRHAHGLAHEGKRPVAKEDGSAGEDGVRYNRSSAVQVSGSALAATT